MGNCCFSNPLVTPDELKKVQHNFKENKKQDEATIVLQHCITIKDQVEDIVRTNKLRTFIQAHPDQSTCKLIDIDGPHHLWEMAVNVLQKEAYKPYGFHVKLVDFEVLLSWE